MRAVSPRVHPDLSHVRVHFSGRRERRWRNVDHPSKFFAGMSGGFVTVTLSPPSGVFTGPADMTPYGIRSAAYPLMQSAATALDKAQTPTRLVIVQELACLCGSGRGGISKCRCAKDFVAAHVQPWQACAGRSIAYSEPGAPQQDWRFRALQQQDDGDPAITTEWIGSQAQCCPARAGGPQQHCHRRRRVPPGRR
jgi:hypothetical protein